MTVATTGIYTALFVICIYSLFKSKKRQYIVFVLSAVIMFVLATTDFALMVRDLEGGRGVGFSKTSYHVYFCLSSEYVNCFLNPYSRN